MSAEPDAAPARPARAPPRLLSGRRLLALFYDAWPALALWFAVSAAFHRRPTPIWATTAARQNIAPFSALQWLRVAVLLAGDRPVRHAELAPAAARTLGIAPVGRIAVAGASTARPSWGALWLRYGVGTLSLLCGWPGLLVGLDRPRAPDLA